MGPLLKWGKGTPGTSLGPVPSLLEQLQYEAALILFCPAAGKKVAIKVTQF